MYMYTYIHVCTYTRTCTCIHRPKTDLGTDELKTEEPSTPRRSARLLAKRSQKESPQPLPAENSSKLSGGSARKKNPIGSAATVTEEEETASLGPRLRSSRLCPGEKSNLGEQNNSELSATEGTTRAESLRGRRKSPSKRTPTVGKSSVSTTSPQKKGTKETVDTSEPDRTSRSRRKGKRSSSAALLSTSPPPKRQKSISKTSPRTASGRSSRKKQESDIDSQPGSSRGAQRGKNNQASHSKTRKTRLVAEGTDSEPDSSKTRKGKSPAKPKSSPLLTAKEKLEGKASAKGKSRASSSKGKGKAGSAATAKRCVWGGMNVCVLRVMSSPSFPTLVIGKKEVPYREMLLDGQGVCAVGGG